MNQQTITGSTDSNGLFTAKNPYERMYSATEHIHHNEFADAHPPLLCYNENNQLVKGVEGLKVKGPVWQFLSIFFNNRKKVSHWINSDEPKNQVFKTFESYCKYGSERNMQTRQVYIAVQPTEKSNKGHDETVHPLPEVSYKINIYNKPDNKTVDILQDGDKIVLTHKQAIELANEITQILTIKR